MARWFNIGGPCNPADHYMLSAAERLPEVVSLVTKKQYFVVHAPRQCGKTTAFKALADEINAKGEMAALYCTLETVQEFSDPKDGLPRIANRIRLGASWVPSMFGGATLKELENICSSADESSEILVTLRVLSEKAGKPLVVFFDEVDCLSDGTLVSFLRQLRDGRISCTEPGSFPISIALIGMRNIRDYKARIRPNAETLGSASPFNVITKAMTLRLFTEEEIRALYRQHTEQTGQIFEEEALKLAWQYSKGQPYLVNALARWCVEEIHHEDFSKPITGADMHEAKEKIIRERAATLNSIWKRVNTDWAVRAFAAVGKRISELEEDEGAVELAQSHGMVAVQDGVVAYSCPLVEQAIKFYREEGSVDAA